MTYLQIKGIGNVFLATILLFGIISVPYTSNWNTESYAYVFYIAISVLLFICLLFKINLNKIVLNGIDVAFFVFLIVYLSYKIFAQAAGFFLFDDGFISIIGIIFIYFFSRISISEFLVVPTIILILSGVELIIAVYQFIHALINPHQIIYIRNLTGTFQNSGVLSIFLTCCIPTIHYFFASRLSGFSFKKTFLIAISLIVAIDFLNESRTSLLLVCIYLLSVLNLNPIKLKFQASSFILKTSILLITGGVFIGLFYLKYPSSIGRLFIWKTSLTLFIEKPFFGWGTAGFDSNYLLEQARYFMQYSSFNSYSAIASDVTNPFNEYILLLVDSGIFGFACLLSISVKLSWVYYRNRSERTIPFASSIILIMLSALVYYSFHVTGILIILALSLSQLAFALPNICILKATKMTTIVILSILVVFVYFNVRLIYGTMLWKRATDNMYKSRESSLIDLNQAEPILNGRRNFLYSYGTILFKLGEYAKSKSVLERCEYLNPNINTLLYLSSAYQKVGKMSLAYNCLSEASNMVPSRFLPKYFLVKFYMQNHQENKAVAIAREILSMDVKVNSKELAIIKSDMRNLISHYH